MYGIPCETTFNNVKNQIVVEIDNSEIPGKKRSNDDNVFRNIEVLVFD